MADASTTMVLRARDEASAVVKNFNAELAKTSGQTQVVSRNTALAGHSVTGMADRMRTGLAPLRKWQSVMGALGLTGLGLSAAAMAIGMRQLVKSVVESDKAFNLFLVDSRRMGLSLSNATSLMRSFQQVYGMVSGTTLASLSEDVQKFVATMPDNLRKSLLQYARELERSVGKPSQKTLAEFKKDLDELGESKAWDNLNFQIDQSRKNMTASRSAWLEFGEGLQVIGNFLYNIPDYIQGALDKMSALNAWFESWSFDPAMWLEGWNVLWGMAEERLGGFGTFWANMWNWVNGIAASVWAFITGGWGKVVEWVREKWGKFGEWWGNFTTAIGDFFVNVWNGVKSVVIHIYNFIVDLFQAAINLVNLFIDTLSRIPLIGQLFMGVGRLANPLTRAIFSPTALPSATAFAAPGMGAASAQITIPIFIGDRQIEEVIVDTLTGVVRSREISG